LEHLDLTQKGWTSKLASRIEKALISGGEEIEFNLKPKNLGALKVLVSLKEGLGSVKIITENNFVTSALNQNENYLQKLFNDQGVNLEFVAQNESQYFGSKNNFNQNSKNEKKNKELIKKTETEKTHENEDQNKSSRHMINVIA
jgi:flagellar hook-length control protein FliK